MLKDISASESEAVVAATIFWLHKGEDPTICKLEGGPIEEGKYWAQPSIWGFGYTPKSRWVDVYRIEYQGFYLKVRIFLVYDHAFKGEEHPCWRALEVVDLWKKREEDQPIIKGRYRATKVGFVAEGNGGSNKGYEFADSRPPAPVTGGYVRQYG